MRKSIRALCAVTSAVMVMGMMPLSAAAAKEGEIIKGNFYYPSDDKGELQKQDYFYSDSYFKTSSAKDNAHLTTMSLVLSLSFSNGKEGVTNLFDQIGFDNVKTYDLDGEPAKDTIGTAIAHKKIGDSDLIAVSLRGTNYEKEWASNFLSGISGDASGFAAASEKVNERLKAYIADNDLKNVKIWISGYSRSGAVADLTGVYINEHPDEFNTSADDVFVYTFEAPLASSSDKKYDNIYCIRDKNDVVNYIYPTGWGFYSNGKDQWVGTDKDLPTYKLVMDKNIDIAQFGSMKQDEFLTEFTVFFSDSMTREEYSKGLETQISALLEMYYGKTPKEREDLQGMVLGMYISQIQLNPMAKQMLLRDFYGITQHNSDKMYKKFADDICTLMDKSTLYTAASAGSGPITAEEYVTLRSSVYPLLRALGPTLVKDYMYSIGINYDEALPADYNDPDFDPDKDPLFTGKVSDELPTGDEDTTGEENTDPRDLAAEAGAAAGFNAGLKDGVPFNAVHGASYDDTPAEGIAAEYADVYKAAYAEKYEEGFKTGTASQISFFHTLTFLKNVENIIGDHYLIKVFDKVKTADGYYMGVFDDEVKGDINGDGIVNVSDIAKVAAYVKGIKPLTEDELARADVNGDKLVNVSDISLLAAHVKGVKVLK